MEDCVEHLDLKAGQGLEDWWEEWMKGLEGTVADVK